MDNGMVLLDPKLGGKIRMVLNTLFFAFAFVASAFDWSDDGWYGTVVKIVTVVLGVIQILTHGTPLGNA